MPQGKILAIAREKSVFILCQTWILPTIQTECVSPFSISSSMYLRSTRCAFQSIPWCGAAVCDPISRLCAWTNAGVTSMGYISILLVIWIFALPLWYHCTRSMWRIWLEDGCLDLTSRGAQMGPKYEISGVNRSKFSNMKFTYYTCHIFTSWTKQKSEFFLSWGRQTSLEVHGGS